MTNTELLNRAIKVSGLKKKYLAEKIGLSPAGFWKCATNRAEFTVSQASILCELLGIEDQAVREAIFFARKGA